MSTVNDHPLDHIAFPLGQRFEHPDTERNSDDDSDHDEHRHPARRLVGRRGEEAHADSIVFSTARLACSNSSADRTPD